MKIKTMANAKNITGAKVLMRVDFNVPIKDAKVKDDFKIRQSLADIRYLLGRSATVVLATHLGEPEGRRLAYSTRPLAEHLSKLLKQPVEFMDLKSNDSFAKARKKIFAAKPGSIFMLENLRFFPGEAKNDFRFAKRLSSLADIYVNNAFAVCHRKAASVSYIKKYLKSYAGWLLAEEVEHLQKALRPIRPLVLVLGGAKIATKMPLIKNLYRRADQILVGGALANDFLAAQGYPVGKSLLDKDGVKIAKWLLAKTKRRSRPEIVFPVDVITSENWQEKNKKKVSVGLKMATQVGKSEYIGDIGPQTISSFAAYIKKAQTIIWNGPLGRFEDDHFRQGTIIVARLIASRSRGRAYGLAGGGETVQALHESKMGQYMDWVSTGGGAMLAYLSGEKLPGLKGIVK